MSSNGTITFSEDIKPLFRESDREAMRKAFDLWSAADVRTHASAIAQRLHDGSMPCDGAWSPEHIALFDRWVAEGAVD
ncbi:hypothetical protein [Microbacterium gorillae]|uniref:hypothetical protein n=1 Tax=Microbacterium gorillae TaxID=1231063 RepID=UPI00058E8D9C|nr:hypothetical protein [Microbacterium gorillae]